MKAKITILFDDETVETFQELFGVHDKEKTEKLIAGIIEASVQSRDDADMSGVLSLDCELIED